MRFAPLIPTILLLSTVAAANAQTPSESTTVTGQAALSKDWKDDVPGLTFHITLADLPPQHATDSANAGPAVVGKPKEAWPAAPRGFVVERVLTDLQTPRKIITAPNGDIFLSETGGGQIRVIRQHGSEPPTVNQVFVGGLDAPFGLAFYPSGPNPKFLYVATTDTVVRYPYHSGDLKATGPGQTLLQNLSNGGGGHSTRDIVFSRDGSRLFVSVGSGSNVMDDPGDVQVETRRARIFDYTPDGTDEKVFASGIRNPVGLAVDPRTGELWTSVNERDGLGDNLVPDYITHVERGEFFGWPWHYMGGTADHRAVGSHPELASHVTTPDVLLQSHSASLCMTFYEKGECPESYDGDAFACEHGSWNRSHRTRYKVIRVPIKNGRATGEYQDFLTGFVVDANSVWGRPVGVTEASDGSLYVTDDGSNSLWHIRYTGSKR